MTQTKQNMDSLYKRLATIGFPKKFVQATALPDWWCKEFEQTNGAEIEAAMYLSRRLNLDVQSLLTEDTQPTFALTSQPKFKTKAGTDTQKLQIPYVLAARVAELVAYACKPAYQPLQELTIAAIRQEILKTRPYVDLSGFVDFCWHRGIPVIHVAEFPQGVHKFDGMVACFDDRPVIIISLKDGSPARLLFIAAHELGHLYSGHLEQDGFLLDEGVELEGRDTEEADANQVAAELLLGKTGISYDLWQKYLSGEQLADKSLEWAKRDHVYPGVIALNIAWNRAHRAETKEEKNIIWATGKNALKILEPSVNAPQLINRYIVQHLDWERLSDDNQDYLEQMLGIEVNGV